MSAATFNNPAPLEADPRSGVDTPRTLGAAFRWFARYASPRILAGLLAVAFGLRLLTGPPGLLDLAVVVVTLGLWTFNEWLIHVTLLHFRPRRIGRFTIDPAVSRKHRAHHCDPRNLDILTIPLQSFVFAVPALVGLAFLLAPTPGVALTAITIYLTLALHYEWIHFLAHTRVRPRTRVYRRVLDHHRRHHYKNENRWYAVSVLGSDRWLGTAGRGDPPAG